MGYTEKLQDPRWQKKRLQIFQRDDFSCGFCGADDQQLDCHHLKYASGKEPWDYPDNELLTLCHTCHEKEHDSRKSTEMRLLELLKLNPASSEEITLLTDVIAKRILRQPYPLWLVLGAVDSALSENFMDHHFERCRELVENGVNQ